METEKNQNNKKIKAKHRNRNQYIFNTYIEWHKKRSEEK